MPIYLFIDLETSGIPAHIGFNEYYQPNLLKAYDSARIVQLGYSLYKINLDTTKKIKSTDYIIRPDNFTISQGSIDLHKITQQKAIDEGYQIDEVFDHFMKYYLMKADYVVCHNANFMINVLKSEMHRLNNQQMVAELDKKKVFDTMELGKLFLEIKVEKNGIFKGYRNPSLAILYTALFNKPLKNQYNAKFDVLHIKQCFCELLKRGRVMKNNGETNEKHKIDNQSG